MDILFFATYQSDHFQDETLTGMITVLFELSLYILSSEPGEKVFHALTLDLSHTKENLLLQQNVLLQVVSDLLHLPLQHPHGLHSEAGPVDSLPLLWTASNELRPTPMIPPWALPSAAAITVA